MCCRTWPQPPDGQDRRARQGGRAARRRQAFGTGGRDVPGSQAAHGTAGDAHQFRGLGGAGVDGVAAARGERAAGAAAAGPGLLAVDAGQQLGALVRGHGPEQAAGIRMHRLAEQSGRGPDLDDASRVHDRDLGHQATDHGEVVAHVDGRHPVGTAQAADSLQDMTLGGDVEPGRRLVQHDQRRPARERHSQRDPLLLAAGELVRVTVQQFRRGVEVSLPHDLGHPVSGTVGGPGVDLEHLPDLGSDPESGVKRRGRVLGHVADPGTARRPQVTRSSAPAGRTRPAGPGPR